MKKFILPAFFAVAAPLAVQAAPTKTPAKTVPTSLNKVAIEPAAQATLNAAVQKYKVLNGLSYRVSTTFQTPKGPMTSPTNTLFWSRPNLVRVDQTGEKGVMTQRLSDGKTVFLPRSETEYQSVEIAPERSKDLTESLISSAGYSFGGVVISHALRGENFANYLKTTNFGGPQSIRVTALPANVVNGISVVGVRVNSKPLGAVPAPPQIAEREETFWFGKADSLLYRVQERRRQGKNWASMGENFMAYGLQPKFQTTDFTYDTTGKKLVTEEDSQRTYDAKLVVGADPFAFETRTLEGAEISPAALKGKVVLLDFWATWCGPCIGELPTVQSVYKENHDKGFEIIGISLDEDKDALTKFIAARKMTWPQIFDGKGWGAELATQYGVRAIPFTLLIGKDGKIAAVNPRGGALAPAVKAALAQPDA